MDSTSIQYTKCVISSILGNTSINSWNKIGKKYPSKCFRSDLPFFSYQLSNVPLLYLLSLSSSAMQNENTCPLYKATHRKKILKKLTACKVENVKSVSEPSGSSGWTLSQPISLVYLKITPSDVHSTCL